MRGGFGVRKRDEGWKGWKVMRCQKFTVERERVGEVNFFFLILNFILWQVFTQTV